MVRQSTVTLFALLLGLCSLTLTLTTAAQAAPGGARSVEIENALYTLEYAYPAAAGRIPALRAMLDADLARGKADIARMAVEGRQDARKNGYEFHPYGLWVKWAVVAELPGWLSLSANLSDYTGGAHPNHHFDAMLWDKSAGKLRAVSDLFVSRKAFVAAVRGDFCAALDKERAKRREGVDMEPGLFEDCVDPFDATIILGSSNRKAFNRIGFLIAPYVAGPYAEGAYEVTLPVTARVLALVRPEYRASFQAMK